MEQHPTISERIARILTVDPEMLEIISCFWAIAFPVFALMKYESYPIFGAILSPVFIVLFLTLIFLGVFHLITLFFRTLQFRIFSSTMLLIIWMYISLVSFKVGSDPDHIIIYSINALSFSWITLRLLMLNHSKNIDGNHHPRLLFG